MSRRSLRFTTPVVVVFQVVVIFAVLAGLGVICGLIWFRLWDPPTGVVEGGQWFTDETGLRAEFAGNGLFVVIGLVAGLLAGVLVALLLARAEVVSLVALVAAAGLAGWVMWKVGGQQSAPDPAALAATAADGTKLPGHLHLSTSTPFVGLPLGAVVGYAVILLSVPKRGHRAHAPADHEPDDQSDDHEPVGQRPGRHRGVGNEPRQPMYSSLPPE